MKINFSEKKMLQQILEETEIDTPIQNDGDQDKPEVNNNIDNLDEIYKILEEPDNEEDSNEAVGEIIQNEIESKNKKLTRQEEIDKGENLDEVFEDVSEKNDEKQAEVEDNEAVKIEVTEPEVEQKHVKELTLGSEGSENTEKAEKVDENHEDKKEADETKDTTEDQDSDESEGVKQVKFEEP